MGLMKDLLLEMEERGYGQPPDKYVCEKCFSDEGLRELIMDRGTSGTCSYCTTTSRTVLPLEDLIDHIIGSLFTEWCHAADSGTPYITREGGCQGPVFSNYDLLSDEEPIESNHPELFDDIINTIHETGCARPFSLPYIEEVIANDWDVLVYLIKHHARFTIFQNNLSSIFKDIHWSYNDPITAIDKILDTIDRLNMITIFQTNKPIYRARFSNKDIDYSLASQMGTVPQKLAKQANRMSPAGIAMFYGALDTETAKAEINIKEPGIIHYGAFYPSHPLILIDFTKKLYLPSIYSKNREIRSDIRLMRSFIKDFSLPIDRNGYEHIDYIPTQVITEYLRFNYKFKQSPIDGILYNSVHNRKKACVLFIDNNMCKDKSTRIDNTGTALYLDKYWKEEHNK